MARRKRNDSAPGGRRKVAPFPLIRQVGVDVVDHGQGRAAVEEIVGDVEFVGGAGHQFDRITRGVVVRVRQFHEPDEFGDGTSWVGGRIDDGCENGGNGAVFEQLRAGQKRTATAACGHGKVRPVRVLERRGPSVLREFRRVQIYLHYPNYRNNRN